MNEMLPLLIIGIALLFDVINGFHDAANSIATVVSTKVLKPLTAVFWAAFFNLFAMFVFGPRVAETISSIIKVVPEESLYVWILFSALIGAIIWDLITWWLGLPTSSSHALIGGLLGAGVAFGGLEVIEIQPILIVIIFIFLSPLIGLLLASSLIILLYWMNRKTRPQVVDRRFRKGQIVSAALYSLGHGANDAQKTMGIILAVLIASGGLAPGTMLSLYHPDTLWIILSCHLAMAVGTFLGGWRIVRTMGMRLTRLRPIGGFAAETGGAVTLFTATLLGVPVSTTHTITGGIIGVGFATTSLAHVKWAVAARIVWAWILTLPGAALISAVTFYIIEFFLK